MIKTNKLTSLYDELEKAQNNSIKTLNLLNNKKRKLKRAIESAQFDFLKQLLKATKLPIDNPIIIAGIILDAKEKLDSPEKDSLIHHYEDLCNKYKDEYKLNLNNPDKTADSTTTGDIKDNGNEQSNK